MGTRAFRPALLAVVALTIAAGALLVGSPTAATDRREAWPAPAVLTAEWWRQVVAIPDPDGPASPLDRCDLGTRHVVFLAGSTGGSATRTCRIPRGKAILVPLINVECSRAEGNGDTPAELRRCADGFADEFTDLELEIDGRPVDDLDELRVATRAFRFTAVAGNVFGIPPGTTLAVADGYWALIPPLRPGKHTISFGGTFPPGPFTTHATYRLSVSR